MLFESDTGHATFLWLVTQVTTTAFNKASVTQDLAKGVRFGILSGKVYRGSGMTVKGLSHKAVDGQC